MERPKAAIHGTGRTTPRGQSAQTPRDRLITVEDRDPRTGVLRNSYTQGELLGKGGFAKCYLATHCTTGEVSALKVIDKKSLTKPKTQQKLKSEIKIHSSLRNKHIVGFKHYFEDENYVYIVLELCEGQTLMEASRRKRRFSEMEASYLIWQMLLALRYMHRLGVIHRDLKLGNVMLTDRMEVKVGDFGLAARLDYEGERKRTVCGTPNYIAPEILDQHSGRGHSFEVDVWTVGVILYTLLVGRPPFETDDVKATYKRIRAVSYSFPHDLRISNEGRDLIHRILQATPECRPTLEELENDRWFRAFPPMQHAPLSLFQPGAAAHSRQQQRLQQAQQRGEMYNAEWLHPRRNEDRAPLQEDVGMQRANIGLQRSNSAAGFGASSGLGMRRNMTPSSARPNQRIDCSPRDPQVRASPAAPVLAPPVLSGASPRYGRPAAAPAPAPTGAGAVLTPQPRLQSTSPHYPLRTDPHASPALGREGSQSTGVTTAPTVGPSTDRGTAVGTDRAAYDHRHADISPAPLPPPRMASHSPEPVLGHRVASSVSPDPLTREPSAGRVPAVTPPGRQGLVGAQGYAHRVEAPQAMPLAPFGAAPSAASAAERRECEEKEERRNLTVMQEALEKTLLGEAPPAPAVDTGLPGPQLWVTEYADFTAKYGLAYRLSNGQTGVHYNDSTKMVWDFNSGNVEYVARIRTTTAEGQTQVSDEVQRVTIEDYPATLKKKITLINYFRAYLHKAKGKVPKENQQEVVTCSLASEHCAAPAQPRDLVYVKRWLRTDRAVIFRLSNKSVQVCFFDKTEIILSSEARLVTYTDESGARSTFSLSSMISHPQQEIAQRLKYTKNIICKLITAHPQP
eukprot:Hpha_TRINITY_DN15552_c1_g6::TRINITY_DN15552_c1_g6_i1::g.106390::m.106390/K06631/PLK1; polo-like kinase 1